MTESLCCVGNVSDTCTYPEEMGLTLQGEKGPQGLTGGSLCPENLTWVSPGWWEDRHKACFMMWHLPASPGIICPLILLPLEQPEAHPGL